MFDKDLLAAWLWAGINRLRGADSERDDPERGDVPGWVMVTVMTAALVVMLLAVFKDKIEQIVHDALDSVTRTAGE